MSGFLLDTHVWLWYLFGVDSLSSSARKLIDRSVEQCWLSPISVWEAGILHRRGKVELDPGLRAWIEDADKRLPLRPAPLTEEVALTSFEVDLDHADPSDRFLVATAKVYDLTLLTADRHLLVSSSVETIAARTRRR